MELSRETAINFLSQFEDIKLSFQLEPSEACRESVGMLRALVLDTETTGLDSSSCELLELAYVIVEFDKDANLLKVIKTFNELQEPEGDIPNSDIHGITMDDVRGKRINFTEVKSDLEKIDVVLAHNSSYDRRVIERYCDSFVTVAWGCTMREVDYPGRGISSAKLEFLAFKCNFFYTAHRALTDVEATLEVIRRLGAFREIMLKVLATTYMLQAKGSPFNKKDILKEKGYKPYYRQGKFVCWYTLVSLEEKQAETDWLMQEARCASVPCKVISAKQRYSIREDI